MSEKPIAANDLNDEALDGLLAAEDAYLPDDGFTARVIASLPPRRRAPTWIIVASTLAGGAGAAEPLAKLFSSTATAALGGGMTVGLALAAGAVVLTMVAGVWALARI